MGQWRKRFEIPISIVSLSLMVSACGFLVGGLDPNEDAAVPPSVDSIKYENQSLKISGNGLDGISSVQLKNASATKELAISQKSASEIVLQAADATPFELTSPLSLVVEHAAGKTTVPLSFQVQDGSLEVSKLAPGSPNSVLTTDSSNQVSWSSNLSVSSLKVDPVATDLTGSLASFKGSVVTGSGTQFATDLRPGDKLLIGGTPLVVSAVISDTQVVVEDVFYAAEGTTSGPVKHGELIFIDQRNADATTITGKVKLPRFGGEYRGFGVYVFARGASLPTISISINGDSGGNDGQGSLAAVNLATAMRVAFGTTALADDVRSATIVGTSSVPARLAMVIVPTTGANGISIGGSGGGPSHDMYTLMESPPVLGGLNLFFNVSPAAITLQPVYGAFHEMCDLPFMVKALNDATDFSISALRPRADASGTVICEYEMTSGGPTGIAFLTSRWRGDLNAPLQRVRGHYDPWE
jgi:hypothetical protein